MKSNPKKFPHKSYPKKYPKILIFSYYFLGLLYVVLLFWGLLFTEITFGDYFLLFTFSTFLSTRQTQFLSGRTNWGTRAVSACEG